MGSRKVQIMYVMARTVKGATVGLLANSVYFKLYVLLFYSKIIRVSYKAGNLIT